MAADDFEDEILERLAGKLDPDRFEACVVDLLESKYSTLVLVPGGQDSGRDGLLASAREDADFLVCTTQEDPTANLRKSIRSHRDHLKPGTRVIFATNRDLNGEARDKLREAAKKEGYVLVQSYDRRNLVPLLYHRPEWCRRLLDLAGDPPALSKIPRSDRPFGGGCVVGREKEARWLAEAGGDCVVSGQPGSGKTFLLHSLCGTSDFYFVVSEDMGRIADGIRKKGPSALVLDDAHIRLDLLRSLLHFRQETGLQFRIIATCWPAEQEHVLAALQSNAEACELDRLKRDQIVEVIKGCGIKGPSEFVRELVNQADGRPGLAVTLCLICLAGNVQGVAVGDALAQDTRRTIEPFGASAYHLLAGLALGGDSGMELLPTARALGLSPVEALDLATKLATGGVLFEIREQRLAVRPPTLRFALVRDVFFSGAIALPHEELIAAAPNPAEVANSLSGARARGGRVRIELILEQAERARSPQALSNLAWAGPEEARIALERHPECLADLAAPCLEHIPEEVIPSLLDKAVGDNRELNYATDHPLRVMSDWVHSGEPGTGEVVLRRQSLHRATIAWLNAGGNVEVGVRSLMIALTPKFDGHAVDPGSGRTITIRSGAITAEEASRVGGLWVPTLAYLRASRGWEWSSVQSLVENWCHPGRLGTTVPADVADVICEIGRGILRDLVPLASGLPGVQQWLEATSERTGEGLGITIDQAFLIVCPVERSFDVDEYKKQEKAAGDLGKSWAEEPPGVVVPRILSIIEEADRAQISFPRYEQALLSALASQVEDPLAWAKEVIARQGGLNVLWPFLWHASLKPSAGWTDVARSCLSSGYARPAADVIFGTQSTPLELVEDAAKSIAGVGDWVEIGALQGCYTEDALRILLSHEDSAVAGAAAKGMWHRTPKRSVPDSLAKEWRSAVVRGVEEDYDLEAALEGIEGLALDWLRERIAQRSSLLFRPRGAVRNAVQQLSVEERAELLRSIDGSDYAFQGLIGVLAGDEPVLLNALFENASLRAMHLEPFRGQPDDAWIRRAIIALDAGYTPKDLAEASFSTGFSWTGNLSDMWKCWIDSFKVLESHDDERIKVIGRLGGERAVSRQEQALKEERERDITGW